ncbi:MAG: TolB protein [Nocardioidaceae bacterium]|jgi:Tol biopolymer transport system component|nr:TolB protein [Nocardioidaceae bacterium]
MTRTRLVRAALLALVGLLLVPSSGASTGATRLPTSGGVATVGQTANGRIAFADNKTGQVYAVNPDGSGLIQLTHVGTGRFAAQPAWSPDGRHIVFTKLNPQGFFRLWVMEANGRHKRLLLHARSNAYEFAAEYTPDGRRIVFSEGYALGDGFAARIDSVRLDGSGLRHLTRLQKPPREAVDAEPSVSPDGRRVVVSRSNGNVNGRLRQLYLMRIDGSHLHPILSPAWEGWSPEWSPDGRRITFSSAASRPFSNVMVMRPSGGHVRRLTRERFPHQAFESGYSPDGRQIVFVSDHRYPNVCCTDLFVITALGTHRTRVDTGLKGVTDPSWGTAPQVTRTSAPLVQHPAEPGTVWPKRLRGLLDSPGPALWKGSTTWRCCRLARGAQR